MPQSLPIDPIGIYMMNPRLGDFILFGLLFFAIVKIALAGSHKLREKGGLMSSFGSALKGHSEHKMDNLLAIALSLILTISLVGLANISLKGLVQSGTFFTILAVVAGFIAYGSFASRFKDENWWMALLSAFFVAVIVYALPTFKPGGQTISGLLTLFVMVIVIFFAMSKTTSKDNTDRDTSRLRNDFGSNGHIDRLGADVDAGSSAARDSEKKRSRLGRALDLARTGSARFSDMVKRMGLKRRMLAAAFAAAILLLPTHSIDQIRAELSKTYTAAIVRTVMSAVSKHGAAATPAQIVDPADAAAFTKELENAAQYCELLEQEVNNYVKSLQQISGSLKTVPNDYIQLKDFMNKIESDLADIMMDSDKLVDRARKTGDTALLVKAEQLKQRIEDFRTRTVNDNTALKNSSESKAPILASDAKSIESSIKLVEDNVPKLQDVSKKFTSSLKELEGAGASSVDIEMFKSISLEYDHIISALTPTLDTAGGLPSTVLAVLSTIAKDIIDYKAAWPGKAIDLWLPDLKKLNDEITAKEKGAVAAKAAMVDVDMITDKLEELRDETGNFNGIVAATNEIKVRTGFNLYLRLSEALITAIQTELSRITPLLATNPSLTDMQTALKSPLPRKYLTFFTDALDALDRTSKTPEELIAEFMKEISQSDMMAFANSLRVAEKKIVSP